MLEMRWLMLVGVDMLRPSGVSASELRRAIIEACLEGRNCRSAGEKAGISGG